MYNSIKEFVQAWKAESDITERVLMAMTDESLSQPVAAGHRTMARIAWHLVTTIPEMMGHTGLDLSGLLSPDAPVPARAQEIVGAYKAVSAVLVEKITTSWDDDALTAVDEMYGEKWERRFTVTALIQHQIHHRGQLTILLRQAGIKVPSIYGPAKEDWQEYDMEAPTV